MRDRQADVSCLKTSGKIAVKGLVICEKSFEIW